MLRIALSALILSLSLTPAIADSAMPDEVIREAVNLLEEGLDSRRDELTADREALYDFIDGILMPRFERRFAAMAVLGKH